MQLLPGPAPPPLPPQAVLNPTILALSGLVGITTTVILFCAHFHQVGFGAWTSVPASASL